MICAFLNTMISMIFDTDFFETDMQKQNIVIVETSIAYNDARWSL